MNGLEFLERVHSEFHPQKLAPIYLCTAARSDQSDFVRASQFSQGVLRKPLQLEDILKLTQEHC
jgi:CheY-like chemotaxis protein